MSFWIKTEDLDAYADDTVFTVLRLETTQPGTNNVLFSNVQLRKRGANDVKMQLYVDKFVTPGTAAVEINGNMDNYKNSWVFVSL